MFMVIRFFILLGRRESLIKMGMDNRDSMYNMGVRKKSDVSKVAQKKS